MGIPVIVPYIAREDYENFRRDIGHVLPEDYSVWSQLFSSQVDEARKDGKDVVLTYVNYDKFIAASDSRSIDRNRKTLIEYAKANHLLREAGANQNGFRSV